MSEIHTSLDFRHFLYSVQKLQDEPENAVGTASVAAGSPVATGSSANPGSSTTKGLSQEQTVKMIQQMLMKANLDPVICCTISIHQKNCMYVHVLCTFFLLVKWHKVSEI